MGKICLLLAVCLTVHLVSAEKSYKHGPSIRQAAEQRGIHMPEGGTMDSYRVRRASMKEAQGHSQFSKQKRSAGHQMNPQGKRLKRSRSQHHVAAPQAPQHAVGSGHSMDHHPVHKRSPVKVAEKEYKQKISPPVMKHEEKRSLKVQNPHIEKRAIKLTKHADEKRSVKEMKHYKEKRSSQNKVSDDMNEIIEKRVESSDNSDKKN